MRIEAIIQIVAIAALAAAAVNWFDVSKVTAIVGVIGACGLIWAETRLDLRHVRSDAKLAAMAGLVAATFLGVLSTIISFWMMLKIALWMVVLGGISAAALWTRRLVPGWGRFDRDTFANDWIVNFGGADRKVAWQVELQNRKQNSDWDFWYFLGMAILFGWSSSVGYGTIAEFQDSRQSPYGSPMSLWRVIEFLCVVTWPVAALGFLALVSTTIYYVAQWIMNGVSLTGRIKHGGFLAIDHGNDTTPAALIGVTIDQHGNFINSWGCEWSQLRSFRREKWSNWSANNKEKLQYTDQLMVVAEIDGLGSKVIAILGGRPENDLYRLLQLLTQKFITERPQVLAARTVRTPPSAPTSKRDAGDNEVPTSLG